MEAKAPVLLVLLVDASRLRWLVAGIGLDGEFLPLVASEDGDLEPYLGLPLDEQLSFLRHRLSGSLQRGCDRLWARQKKPCQIVFIAAGRLNESAGPLTGRLAEHFVDWLTNPPVVFFISEELTAAGPSPPLEKLAGEIEPDRHELLNSRLGQLYQAADEPDRWEQIRKKGYTAPAS